MLTREQLRAARHARGWGLMELATATGRLFGDENAISRNTINKFENGGDSKGDTLRRLQVTLEAEGIEFLNTGRPGVRWDDGAPAKWAEADAQRQAPAEEIKKGGKL